MVQDRGKMVQWENGAKPWENGDRPWENADWSEKNYADSLSMKQLWVKH